MTPAMFLANQIVWFLIMPSAKKKFGSFWLLIIVLQHLSAILIASSPV